MENAHTRYPQATSTFHASNRHHVSSYLGVTRPISVAGSNAREKEVTVTLMDELRRQNMFESEEESKTKEMALGRVAALVKKFVKKVSMDRDLSETAANAVGFKIVPFGSYRLGVYAPGSDINTLCVVPKHVSREDFFDVFEPMLQELEGVTNVMGVPKAYIPIIKAEIDRIPLEFSMAKLALPSIPDSLTLNDGNILRSLDKQCIRSLNGSRDTDEILQLVPNVQVFRDALRCIKLWAQRRAIYSDINGFLGGVAWALLVARICQLYPNAIAGAIVSRFFIIMGQWSWPHPVLLKLVEGGPLQARVWNPKLHPSNRAHLMPIITPAHPAMCCTHNVTQSTQMIITKEFKRGAEIVDRVIVGTAEWSELFAKHDFFHDYRYYLQVIASTANQELQTKWSGTVESRLRQLVMKLEHVDSLVLARPFVKGFDQVSYCLCKEEIRAVAQGEISDAVAKRKKPDIEGKEGGSPVWSTTFYIGLALEPKPIGAVGPRKIDLSYPATQFTNMVKTWDKFDETTMGIVVRHIKSSGLPDNIFDPGERSTLGQSAGPKRLLAKFDHKTKPVPTVGENNDLPIPGSLSQDPLFHPPLPSSELLPPAAPPPETPPPPSPSTIHSDPSDFSVPSTFIPHIQYRRGEELRQRARQEESTRSQLEEQRKQAEAEERVIDTLALKVKIRDLDAEVQKLHKKAARTFFSARNHKPTGVNEIDVHGLRPLEAFDRVERAIVRVSEERGSILRVIVGKGIHSINQIPALKPAICKEMQRLKLQCEVDERNTGVLIITLPPPRP